MSQGFEHIGTSWKGQELKHKIGWIDRLDPRIRILVALVFSLAIVPATSFWVLLFGLFSVIILAISARLDIKRTLRRVLAMDMFMVFLIILLPFTTQGEELFSIHGASASKEGLLAALQIIIKANAVVFCLLAMIGTMTATTLGYALAHLKLSDKLVHLLLFTVRYLAVIGQEYKRMRRAMQARAFVMRANLHTWRIVGYLIGMLLVHSLERSERIMVAMKCRGYKGRFYLMDNMTIQQNDKLFIGGCVPFFALLIGLNFI